MKKIIISLCWGLIIISKVIAQQSEPVNFSVNSGMAFFVSPEEVTDYWSKGFILGAGLGIPFTPQLMLQVYFDFNNFKFDKSKYLRDYGFGTYGISISGGSITAITVAGNLKINLVSNKTPSSVYPYLLGGVGLFRLSIGDMSVYDTSDVVIIPGEAESDFSVLLGLGFDIPVGEKINLFIEGRYIIAFTDGDNPQILPIKLGISFK